MIHRMRILAIALVLWGVLPVSPEPVAARPPVTIVIGTTDFPRSLDPATAVDALARDDPAQDYYSRVHFVYLKTTAANPPARLDVPAWVLETGQLEWVMDVTRAECIVGVGYPYAAETADAVAVITATDRERFYRTLQEFIDNLGLDLRYARKAYSKRGRR